MKKVQVNTPLILEQNGELVRIDTGQVIDLTDDVYAQVSAHTTLLDNGSDTAFEPQPDADNEVVAEVPNTDEVAMDEPATDSQTTDAEAAEPKKYTRKKA